MFKLFENNKKNILKLGSGLGTFLSFIVLSKSFFKIEPGFLAIKFNTITGVQSKVYREGFHILIPFLEKPILYDCRMKNHLNNCLCGSKDLQTVNLKIRIVCRPKIDSLPQLYRLLGMNYDERVLTSIIQEICGVAVSQYNASQIVSQRDSISFLIKKNITEKARNFYIDVDDVALIDIKFSKEFSEAIELKQVAQQEAERTKILVEQAILEKKSTIIKAMGEAEAVQKFGEANKSSFAFLTLRKLEASKNISKILANGKNKVILDSNSYFMNLPITNTEIKIEEENKTI